MTKFYSLLKLSVSALAVMSLMISSALNMVSGEKTYLPKNEEEVQVLSLVLADEIKANGLVERYDWFFDGRIEPGSLTRQIHSPTRLEGSQVNGMEQKVQLWVRGPDGVYALDLSGSMKVRSKVVDLREINTGQGDLQ